MKKKIAVKPTKRVVKKPHYSPETWATIEGLFESSRYNSIESLHKHCTKIFTDRCPSIDAIKQRFARKRREGKPVDKNKSEEKLKEKTRKDWAQLFETRLPDEFVADLITEGALAGKKILEKVLTKIDANESPVSPEMVELMGSLYTNLKVSHQFLKERNRLVDAYPVAKLKLSGSVKTLNSDIKEMTEEELIAEHRRLEKETSGS